MSWSPRERELARGRGGRQDHTLCAAWKVKLESSLSHLPVGRKVRPEKETTRQFWSSESGWLQTLVAGKFAAAEHCLGLATHGATCGSWSTAAILWPLLCTAKCLATLFSRRSSLQGHLDGEAGWRGPKALTPEPQRGRRDTIGLDCPRSHLPVSLQRLPGLALWCIGVGR